MRRPRRLTMSSPVTRRDTKNQRRVAQPSASHRTSVAPRIDFAGAASFAFFFSARGAGLDAALPNLVGRYQGVYRGARGTISHPSGSAERQVREKAIGWACQSLLGTTIFVKPLRSPHAFLMHGGLLCMLRI